jgi:hypothetical protein
MTRKDYQLVAEAIGAAYKARYRLFTVARYQPAEITLMVQSEQLSMLVATVATLGARFKADNPGFQRAKFAKAVRDAAGIEGTW